MRLVSLRYSHRHKRGTARRTAPPARHWEKPSSYVAPCDLVSVVCQDWASWWGLWLCWLWQTPGDLTSMEKEGDERFQSGTGCAESRLWKETDLHSLRLKLAVLCWLPQEPIDLPEGSILTHFTSESRTQANPDVVVLLTAARKVRLLDLWGIVVLKESRGSITGTVQFIGLVILIIASKCCFCFLNEFVAQVSAWSRCGKNSVYVLKSTFQRYWFLFCRVRRNGRVCVDVCWQQRCVSASPQAFCRSLASHNGPPVHVQAH